jgi:flavin reductase (DIM6/NTAB) family NADH-FMN oxidoreductase RutF
MQVDLKSLPLREAYTWMIGTIVPRPIAWVSTISDQGIPNLAPFSFFQGVTANPPTLLFIPGNNRNGEKKDTVKNLEQIPEFVVNLVPASLAEVMNSSSADLPYNESEFDKFSVPSAPSSVVKPPRVANAPVSFECKVHSVIQVGNAPQNANIVIGTIELAHFDEDVLGPDGFPDPEKLDLIGRMGGNLYARTRDLFSLSRPGERSSL